jgi:PAS domain S-box-containing protein
VSSPDRSTDPDPPARVRPARVWVLADDDVARALAAASDGLDPVSVDPDRLPAETPAAVVAVDLTALDAALPATETALVGADADVAAGYEAGADAVVPVDPTARPGPVVAWLERTAARTAEDARYRALFDETSDGIVVHDAETGDVVEANDRFRELLGLDPDEPVTVESFAVGEYDAERARELVRDVAANGPQTVEWVDERPDGGRFRVEVVLSPATIAGRDRVVSTVVDVGDRHDRREQFERTLERVDDAFFAVDEDWRFTYLNEAGAEVINGAARGSHSVSELRGRHIWELIPEAVDTEFYEEYHAAMERQEPRRFESYYPPLDAWFEVRAYPSPDGLSVYFSDVTGRREREDALRELFDTARALMRAESRGAVADRLAEAATATLGFEATGVRLRTADDRLVSVAVDGADGDRPALSMDSPHGRALRAGEAVVDEVSSEDPYGRDRHDRVLYVPIGDRGVLSLGRADGAFDEVDRRLAGLLAALGESAFDRVDRRAELRRYEAVLETAEGMVFVVDGERRLSLVTEPLAERLGYDRDDLIGAHVSAVLDDEAVAETAAIREALRTGPAGRSQTFEVAVLAADGERVPLEVELTAFDHEGERGTVGVVTDRTALRDAQAALATERDRLTYLFENLPDPAVEYDVDPLSGEAVVRSANAAFCDLFGLDRDRVTGAPLADLVPGYDAADAPERTVGTTPGEVVRAEVDREDGDDRPRQFLFRGVSFRADDRVRAFGIYTDVTDARRRERYLGVVSRVLRHNLRNDLNVLLGYADRLRDEAAPGAPAADTAERIAAVVDDLARLSENARDLAQVVERGGDRDRTVVDLAAVARSVADRAPDVVAVDLPDSLPALADERVERALFEVVENAVEYGSGGRAAESAGRSPRVEAARADGWVGLRVVDDGPGIPETERAVVAGEREITQTEHGSGLGLWLARWIAEDAGGRLEFEEPDAGASVVLWFPAA